MGVETLSRMDLESRIREFLRIVEEAEAVKDSEASWETKYDIIFGDLIRRRIEGLGIDVEWFDPEMGYDDDVIAYVDALGKKKEELALVLSELEKRNEAEGEMTNE